MTRHSRGDRRRSGGRVGLGAGRIAGDWTTCNGHCAVDRQQPTLISSGLHHVGTRSVLVRRVSASRSATDSPDFPSPGSPDFPCPGSPLPRLPCPGAPPRTPPAGRDVVYRRFSIFASQPATRAPDWSAFFAVAVLRHRPVGVPDRRRLTRSLVRSRFNFIPPPSPPL